MHAALAALPPQLREPLEQFAFEDRAQADIAAGLGCTVKAVEARVYHARQRVLHALESDARKSEGFRLPRRMPKRKAAASVEGFSVPAAGGPERQQTKTD